MKNLIIISGISIVISIFLFSCEKADISVNITSYEWKVKSIDKVLRRRAKESYILRFGGDSSCTINLDVNGCWTSYEIIEKGKIDFGGLGCTEVCCDSGFAETLSDILENVTDYYMKGDLLYLTGNGEITLEKYNE